MIYALCLVVGAIIGALLVVFLVEPNAEELGLSYDKGYGDGHDAGYEIGKQHGAVEERQRRLFEDIKRQEARAAKLKRNKDGTFAPQDAPARSESTPAT